MQAAIKEAYGVDAKLTGGSGGILRVEVDGNTVFDRHSEGGRYPEPEEIVDLMKS